MRAIVFLLAIDSLGLAQVVGAYRGQQGPSRIPSPPPPPPAARRVVQPRFWGGWGGGFGTNPQVVVVERPEAKPEKEDKLKELVVSPTYQKEKIQPKLIEIP
jgi:hypothetical protein